MDTFEQLGDVVKRVLDAIRKIDQVWIVWKDQKAFVNEKEVWIPVIDSIYLRQEDALDCARDKHRWWGEERTVNLTGGDMNRVWIIWTNDVEEIAGEKIRIPVIYALYDTEEGAREATEKQLADAKFRHYWYEAYPVHGGTDERRE